jgi:hypothetical protein
MHRGIRVLVALAGAASSQAGCGLDWVMPVETETEPGAGTGGTTDGSSGVHVSPSSSGAGAGSSSSGSTVPVSTTASSWGAGGAPPDCDAPGATCDECNPCSAERGCRTSVEACLANTECALLDDCLWGCDLDTTCVGDCYDACLDDCFYVHAAGEPLHTAALVCIICDVCVTSCDDYQQGLCY